MDWRRVPRETLELWAAALGLNLVLFAVVFGGAAAVSPTVVDVDPLGIALTVCGPILLATAGILLPGRAGRFLAFLHGVRNDRPAGPDGRRSKQTGGLNDAGEQWVAQAHSARRAAVTLVRQTLREELTGFTEDVLDSKLVYCRGGVAEVAVADRRSELSVLLARSGALADVDSEHPALDRSGGAVRFGREATVDVDLLRSVARAAVTADGQVLPFS